MMGSVIAVRLKLPIPIRESCKLHLEECEAPFSNFCTSSSTFCVSKDQNI